MFVCYCLALGLTLSGRHTASKVLYNYGTTVCMFVASVLFAGIDVHMWLLATMAYAAAVYSAGERWWRVVNMALSFGGFAFFEWHANSSFLPTNAAFLRATTAADFVHINNIMVGLTLGAIVAFMAYAVRHTEHHLEQEHDKSESLLLNILPRPIAERLKASPQTIADGFPHVTVLFSDIVGFTPMSEKLSPRELVAVLNQLFTGFDRIAAEHGLEKIKTIGDAYMVAGGLPVPTLRHAQAVADFALQARDFALAFGAAQDPPLGIRIGIHSGPVVAGVIGESKFAYDLWGDTVNTASRMESSGVPGRIQCSEATWALLADDYVFEARGTVAVKGKGEMRTFFLDGHGPGDGPPAATPSPP